MLARDAENLYWMSRYLGRAENTARLIISTTDTLLDLPYGASLGWGTLLQIAGIDHLYKAHFDSANEKDIMYFLIADERNPSSIVCSIKYARENTRTLREMLPEELWERINGLYLFIKDNLDEAARNRRSQYLFLQNIISQRHAIIGLIASCMERDMAYQFIRLGTNIERADMTTRIMDISYAITMPENAPLYEVTVQTLWVGILKALSAFQTYRKLKNIHVVMGDVVDFLYTEYRFPRSVSHCLNEMEDSLTYMPQSQGILEAIKLARNNIALQNTKTMNIAKLHDFIDLSQQYIGNIHHAITSLYFRAYENPDQVQMQTAA